MRKWLPLVTISLGTFMLLIDVTIVNVALPDMATSLRTTFSDLQWVIDIYALSLAALLLGVGSFSDLVGRRNVYIGGLVLFAVSSLAAGTAADTTLLIVARGVQGIGAAAMFATTIALINTAYTGRDRGIAFGVWGAINGAAAAAGPILGGLLTEGLSWRWIFFVNLPISVVAVLLSLRVLPADEPRRGGRIDVLGVATFTLGAGALTLGLTRASDAGWGSAQTLGLLACGVAAIAAFLLVEGRQRAPLIELSLLRRASFSAVLAASFLLAIAAFAYLTYTSLWLQSVRGMSPIQAGAALIPLSLSALLVSLLAGRFLHGDRARWAIGGGLLLIGAGALMQAHLGAGSTWTALVPGFVVAGVGVGLASPCIASAALAAVPMERGGMASGAVNTARQLGYALGIAGLGVVVQSRISDHLHQGARAVAGGQAQALVHAAPAATRTALDAAIHGAFADALNGALLLSGVAGLLGGVVVLLALRPRAAQPSAARPHAAAEPQRSAAGQTSR